mgnify:FL=1
MFKIFQEGQCVILLGNYIEHLQQVYNTKLSGEGTMVSTLDYGINGSEFKPSRGRMFIPICYL